MNIDFDGVSLDLSFLPEDVHEKAKTAIESAYAASVNGLKSKRDQLLQRNKDLQKQVENAGEGATADVLRQLTETQERLSTVENDLQVASHNLHQTEQKLATSVESANNWEQSHNNLVKSQGLAQELAKLGVSPNLLDGAIAVHMPGVSLGDDNTVLMGEKPLGDALKEWADGDVGKAYIAAGANSGGSADGSGSGSGSQKNPWAKDSFNVTEQMRIGVENPELAAQLQNDAAA